MATQHLFFSKVDGIKPQGSALLISWDSRDGSREKGNCKQALGLDRPPQPDAMNPCGLWGVKPDALEASWHKAKRGGECSRSSPSVQRPKGSVLLVDLFQMTTSKGLPEPIVAFVLQNFPV